MPKDAQAQPGDHVNVVTKDETIEGILLPRPEILKHDTLIVKLHNGYNIGIDKKRIEHIEVVKPHKQKEVKREDYAPDPKLPTVAIISFGGTISSRIDYKTGGVRADYDANDIVAMCPKLTSIANIQAKKAASLMSEDICPEDWTMMAETIKPYLDDDTIAGVVITIGTDTFHYITAALSLMLQNITKPIIVTASQRSIDRGSSDAFMNLTCAVAAAARFDGKLVVSCMHAHSDDDVCALIRGTKVRKMHTSRRDAFRPINDMSLANVAPDGTITTLCDEYPKTPQSDTPTNELTAAFERKVGLLQVYPGIDAKLIDFFTENNYRGLILSATALGHVPTNNRKHTLLPAIKRAIKSGMLVVIASQTLYGRTHPYVYTNLRKLSIEAQCVFAQDMTPETAYVKLGWSLGKERDVEKARELFLTSVAGELLDRTTAQMFLN